MATFPWAVVLECVSQESAMEAGLIEKQPFHSEAWFLEALELAPKIGITYYTQEEVDKVRLLINVLKPHPKKNHYYTTVSFRHVIEKLIGGTYLCPIVIAITYNKDNSISIDSDRGLLIGTNHPKKLFMGSAAIEMVVSTDD